MDYSNVRALADKWRNDNPGHDGGVVLIWIDQEYGWKSTLVNRKMNVLVYWPSMRKAAYTKLKAVTNMMGRSSGILLIVR